ncbi:MULTISPECIES: hypothetical protein [Novosphingobium]|uniref:Uncharacterized protein n=1 Tax=Novosphingobium pentaromativorans US6-1 TaxID=1088721 RepID=G6E9V7_9SPHN|nr:MULTISPECIES: hypothetical protein [Novosphingobium]AIT80896.1 hypothetical protein JI59_14460 [Novosphingobium pentaromativorans US6-1]EHJ61814.1 hypothetical protein NSU_1128 [Novosphingobium pentaromativorans US6-1]GFM28551.1 uncharacterized protein PY1_contig-04-599 [Novosphingobium sp. PY1]
MESNLSSAEYIERAQMHDGLANSTADPEARKMHRAMAAAYRRKAERTGIEMTETPIARGPVLEAAIPVGARA